MTLSPATGDIATAVIEQIDEALKDDNLETRQGLRFMATVLRQAMRVIGDVAESKGSTNTRLTLVEGGLNEFLKKQEIKDKKAEEERQHWRWAIFGPMIVLLLNQAFDWVRAFMEWIYR